MKVTLSHTNNPAYAGLTGREGDLQIQNGQFKFTYMDGHELKSFSSHVDGQLGQLGHYKSPEVVIRTGVCEFVFDQRAREQEIHNSAKNGLEQISPNIITYAQYNKATVDFIDSRRRFEKTGQGKEEFEAAKAKFENIIDAERKGDLIIVSDLNKYIETKLSQTDRESGKIGDFEFNKIACSDIVAIYGPSGDMVATYSQGHIVMGDGHESLEEFVDGPVKDMSDYRKELENSFDR